MISTQNLNDLPQGRRVLALGNFDGVHLGHQALLQYTVNLAKQLQALAVAMGFSPHPLEVLGKPVEVITTAAGKRQLVATLGLDAYLDFPFTKQIAQMAPADFVQQILLQQAQAAAIVVGFNYSFGRDAAGNAADLKEFLNPYAVQVHIIPPILYSGKPISSSRIRRCLQTGDLTEVEAMLGRPYSLTGVVQQGDQRGRQLGFPTINFHVLKGLALPPFGVYAAEIVGLGIGMANLGLRPTFLQAGPTLEVHIFDYTGDLYGQELEVRLLRYVRSERHFSSIDELQTQLTLDEKQIRDSFLN